MKKYMIHILTVLVVCTLAACDFDITNPGGGGHGGGGRDTMDIDTNYREPMLIDIHNDEVVTTRAMKMISVNSVSVSALGFYVVELNVINGKTGEVNTVTLSSENPTAEVDGCLITLLGVRPMPGLPGEETKYVVSLQIM
ncbi:MAG: hypothetical protein ACE364_12565 [Chlorobiota bacterium]